MWRALWEKIKEVFQRMLPNRTIEQTLHITPIISNKMFESMKLWDDMYKDQAPWLHEPSNADPTRIVSLGLPAMIASEKARMAVLEMKSEITVPVEKVKVKNTEGEETEQQPTNQPKKIQKPLSEEVEEVSLRRPSRR